MTDADPWTSWEGGDCPVCQHTTVEIKLRCGRAYPGAVPAAYVAWQHYGRDNDVVAYRLAGSTSVE